MAINSKTWANGNHWSVVESQNLQDNSVNIVDDIHPQYLPEFHLYGAIHGVEFTTANSHAIVNSGGSAAPFITSSGAWVFPLFSFKKIASMTFTKVDITFDFASHLTSGATESLIFTLANSSLSVVGQVTKNSGNSDSADTFKTFSNEQISFAGESTNETMELYATASVTSVNLNVSKFRKVDAILVA